MNLAGDTTYQTGSSVSVEYGSTLSFGTAFRLGPVEVELDQCEVDSEDSTKQTASVIANGLSGRITGCPNFLQAGEKVVVTIANSYLTTSSAVLVTNTDCGSDRPMLTSVKVQEDSNNSLQTQMKLVVEAQAECTETFVVTWMVIDMSEDR